MDEETRDEEVMEESEEQTEESSEDNREEETKDEIRDEVYVNDDEIEMLRSIEKRFDSLEEKLDNAISMMVDSGAMVQDVVDEPNDNEDYEEDFINIDELDLAL